MTRLDPETYLSHIVSESRRFREALTDVDPGARVPSCPEWTAADLLWHLVGVQDWWGWCVDNRPRSAEDGYPEPERPTGDPAYAEMLGRYDTAAARLASALEHADPAEEAWTWKSDEHTVGFILRRQAHEALIHRVDAEQTAGVESEIDAVLAADGVEEVLDVMYGGMPSWGSWSPLPHYVRFDMRDVDESVWVQFGHFSGTDPEGVPHEEDDLHVVADPGIEPDAVIEAGAAELDLRLWKRGPGEHFRIAGDRSMVDRVRQVVHPPIN